MCIRDRESTAAAQTAILIDILHFLNLEDAVILDVKFQNAGQGIGPVSYTHLKKLVFCAICVALCVVLPMAFHALGSGTVFLPMHVPVLLCGLVCTWPYGVVCGLLGPLLSSVLTGMPAAAVLPSMMAELAVYGLVTALVMRLVHTLSLIHI